MTVKRMNREQFFGKLGTLDEERLKRALWNLYWRGSANLREKIEAELEPGAGVRAPRLADQVVDPQTVLSEVGEFVALARSGAYMAGDRRVSPKERTRWRFTFQRLASAARALLSEDFTVGSDALEQMVDLACETRGYDYFRSEDPMEAANFVVSDAVAALWETARDRHGFTGFAERAAPQLIRWESEYGWTRSGYGRVSEKETSLAGVLARMLRGADAWADFSGHYLHALDQVTHASGTQGASAHLSWRSPEHERAERARNLTGWHTMLLERLEHTDVEERLDRLVEHPALGGPELTYLRARRAVQRGETDSARKLMHECLDRLPGHQGFLDFAAEIGAPLPPRAQRVTDARRHQ